MPNTKFMDFNYNKVENGRRYSIQNQAGDFL